MTPSTERKGNRWQEVKLHDSYAVLIYVRLPQNSGSAEIFRKMQHFGMWFALCPWPLEFHPSKGFEKLPGGLSRNAAAPVNLFAGPAGDYS
jgi:hypothetical protein